MGVVLETERLLLCKVDIKRDLDAFTEFMSNPDSLRYIGNRTMDRVTAWRYLAQVMGHWQIRGYGFMSVIEKETRAWVGRVGPWFPLGWPQPEVGWAIHPDHLRKGFGAEAARACVDYAFDELGWDEVIHVIIEDNAPSIALAKSIGSTLKGDLPGIPGVTDERCFVYGQSRSG
ncbi:MAG: GNAT family N-acetyltransferase [Pseudomonadota bacterium]